MTTTDEIIAQADILMKKDVDQLGRRNASFCQLLLRFIGIYWRTFVVILCPILLCGIFLYDNTTTYKCMFVVAIMAIYWMTEALPPPVTAFIPMLLYPLLGILGTSTTINYYINDTIVMFMGSLVLATAIEHSGLHVRIALLTIRMVGCSHRRLSFGFLLVTMFIGLWITNTATTAMMVPIIESVLVELEKEGLGQMFVPDEDSEIGEDGQPGKKPTHTTLAYYLTIGYASSIGGTGTMVGTGTNLTFKGIYEARFPDSPGINFSEWIYYSIPPMLLCGILVWVWLQVMYMGLFRPNSQDARAINIGEEGEKVAREVMDKKYKELGPMSWHESCVAILFAIAVLLWFFRNPGFMTGWPGYITDVAVSDSTAVIFVMIMMFIIPKNLEFTNAFSKDPSKRPENPTQGLLNWKLIQSKMHWGLMFVLGGGFALAGGSTSSGLSDLLGNALSGLGNLHPVAILFIVCLIVELVTELTSNVAIANIVLPVIAELCVAIRLHPMYLMLPATFCCSYSFHLPVGTPTNAIICAAGNIKTKTLIVSGIGPTVITLVVLVIAFPTWGNFIYGLDEFPSWAEPSLNTTSIKDRYVNFF